MPTLARFWTPANVQDLSSNPSLQDALNQQWNTNLDGFTQQGILGNPWQETNASDQNSYYNPLVTDAVDPKILPIQWSPFPGRIDFYFSSLSTDDQMNLADTGLQLNGSPFPAITTDPCSRQTVDLPYGPFGPRGWLDEYCEWAIEKDSNGNILRVDFTCENPEYWYTLWMFSPQTVCDIYRSTLAKPQVQLSDLYLYDPNNPIEPVIDPSTGQPAYNPLNKWNSGTVSDDTQGGAMHLTSTPNTLQTEIGLAGAATVQRRISSRNAEQLICCSLYGQPFRNSDPNIGQGVNQLVSLDKTVTLTNPAGLYIQMPNFGDYRTPDGSDPSDYWTIVRGSKTLNDENGNPLPNNFILHAKYEVPASKGFTVSDITINGQKIQWAGQIARTFLMEINGTAFSKEAPSAQDCVGTASFAQPLQLFHAAIFSAYARTPVPNPISVPHTVPMNLLSNTTLIAPFVNRGSQNLPMVLTIAGFNGQLPSVTFDGPDITATVRNSSPINYAVPGNTNPANVTALLLNVNVASNAQTELRSVFVTNSGQPSQPAMPALLSVR